MSNANVGAVYEHIIDEVINTVRVDFEEGGVGEDILEELKKVSALSHFPVIITSLLRQPGWRSASTPIRFPLSFSSCFSFSSKWDEHGFFITDASFLQRRSASAGALVRIVGMRQRRWLAVWTEEGRRAAISGGMGGPAAIWVSF